MPAKFALFIHIPKYFPIGSAVRSLPGGNWPINPLRRALERTNCSTRGNNRLINNNAQLLLSKNQSIGRIDWSIDRIDWSIGRIDWSIGRIDWLIYRNHYPTLSNHRALYFFASAKFWKA